MWTEKCGPKNVGRKMWTGKCGQKKDKKNTELTAHAKPGIISFIHQIKIMFEYKQSLNK